MAVFGLVMQESRDRVAGVATYSKTNPKRGEKKLRIGVKKAYRNNNRDNLLHLLPRYPEWSPAA
jgi:hypothetical protein